MSQNCWAGLLSGIKRLRTIDINQTISHEIEVIDRYLDLAEEWQFVGSFLDFQDTWESPIKTQQLVINLRLVEQLAQSESQIFQK